MATFHRFEIRVAAITPHLIQSTCLCTFVVLSRGLHLWHVVAKIIKLHLAASAPSEEILLLPSQVLTQREGSFGVLLSMCIAFRYQFWTSLVCYPNDAKEAGVTHSNVFVVLFFLCKRNCLKDHKDWIVQTPFAWCCLRDKPGGQAVFVTPTKLYLVRPTFDHMVRSVYHTLGTIERHPRNQIGVVSLE